MSNPLVEVDLLYTPLETCERVSLGTLDGPAVAHMRGLGFDDAPVMDGTRVLGVVGVDSLLDLVRNGQPLTVDHVRLTDRRGWLACSANTRVPAGQILEALVTERCTFVCDAPPSLLNPAGPVRGFLTISDLNRHVFRTAMYLALAELEARLALTIETRFPDPWDWIDRLNEDHRVQILGFWELSKRAGLDVGPVSGATLTNLLVVAARDLGIISTLGYASKTKFEQAIGGIPTIRNAVMHPARPLVTKHSDVQRALKTLKLVTAMSKALEGASTR